MSGKFNAELDPLGGGVANKEPPLGVQQMQNGKPIHSKGFVVLQNETLCKTMQNEMQNDQSRATSTFPVLQSPFCKTMQNEKRDLVLHAIWFCTKRVCKTMQNEIMPVPWQ